MPKRGRPCKTTNRGTRAHRGGPTSARGPGHEGTVRAQPAVRPAPGYPRIGLINGRQLVDLLVEHWNKIPPEFHECLGLKPGLVRI